MDEQTMLREQLQAQQAVIERLEERLDRLEHEGPRPSERVDRPEVAGERPMETVTDRRHLLTSVATVAAGAAVGGTALVLGQASPAEAAQGVFDGNPAVTGLANPDYASGVYGQSKSGAGLSGYTETGQSAFLWTEKGAHLRFFGNPNPPLTSTVTREVGLMVKDVNNDLWLCVAGGLPGRWRKLAGPATAGAFHARVTPARVYDSRAGFPPLLGVKAPLVGGVARSCDLKANNSGVPAGATAVMVNLVATGTTGASGGFLAVYTSGIAWQGNSSLNWSAPNQNVAVTTLTTVDPNALCNLYANVATNVVVDVLGYYQ